VTELPADVEGHYRGLAARRRWPPETVAAFLASVAWYRGLDEGGGPRHYFEFVDHEGLEDEGARWLWEVVMIDDELVAIKQLELPSAGGARRYWWRQLEDDPLSHAWQEANANRSEPVPARGAVRVRSVGDSSRPSRNR
jgi:hypothetical protein